VANVDWKDCGVVEVIPGKVSGRPLLKGTRMHADDVVENHESGSAIDEIAYNFDLKPEDIRQVLIYAASHQTVKSVL